MMPHCEKSKINPYHYPNHRFCLHLRHFFIETMTTTLPYKSQTSKAQQEKVIQSDCKNPYKFLCAAFHLLWRMEMQFFRPGRTAPFCYATACSITYCITCSNTCCIAGSITCCITFITRCINCCITCIITCSITCIINYSITCYNTCITYCITPLF